jgi:DNA invertase Pin-like site-specific DNA recombinase
MKATMYLRKSRADDPHETIEVTLKRHEDSLRQLAASEGIHIVSVYREVVSGERLCARKQMQRLLAACETGGFESILCMDIDRLGRGSMAEQGIILETIKRANMRIITPRKVYDLNNDLDETYSEFESFMARQELKLIKRRLQRGVRRTTAEGGVVSAPPYGYRRVTINGHPSLAPVEEEAEAVRLIFAWYTGEGLGCQQIAARLHAMGVLPRRAAAFGRTAVLDILKNPLYCGRVLRHCADGSLEVDGLHPPLICEQEFAAAQTIRRARAHPPTTARTLQNPLAGLIVCGICGAPLQRLPATATRRQESLACPRTGCNVAARLGAVEEAVVTALLPLLPPIIQPKSAPFPAPDTVALRRQLDKRRERLYTLVEQGVYTPSEFAERRTTLDAQRAALPTTTTRISSPTPIDTATAYARADAAGRNAFLRLFIEKITYIKQKNALPENFSLEIVWK